jgi:Cof subfamily protein (haloacid dehalogenase superfamily)
MVKMLAADLDNTLLRSDKTISRYTSDVLKRSRDSGLRLAFATARPLRTITPYMRQTPCDAVIYHNGAHIIADGEQIGDVHTIPIGIARGILGVLQKKYPGERLSVEIDDVLYANFDVSSVWNYTSFVMTDFTDLPDAGADKILIEADLEIKYEDILSLLKPDIYCQISEGRIYLIMNRNATKLNAIKTLTDHWGISLDDVAAFGDDHNDVEMLKECGIGVAVGNAIQEAADAADVITDSNDEDGVAKYIEANLLQGR